MTQKFDIANCERDANICRLLNVLLDHTKNFSQNGGTYSQLAALNRRSDFVAVVTKVFSSDI